MGKDKDQTWLFLLVILSVSVILRTVNLETIPHWYWDEGVNMNIAWNLANGRMQWFCLQYAFVPHPPLFFMVSAALLTYLGNSLLVLRALCAFYGTLTVLVVYLIGKEMLGRKTGLLASLLFAIYPTAVYWNRMGFANNQLMFMSMLTLYSTLVYLNHEDKRWFYLAGLLTGLSMVTEILGVAVFLAVFAVLWVYKRVRLLEFMVVSAIIPLIFVASMMELTPDAFISDILHNSGRANYVALLLVVAIIAFLTYPSKLKDVCIDYMHRIYGPVIKEVVENLPIFYLVLSFIVFLMPPSDDAFVQNFDYFWLGFVGFYFIREKRDRNILLSFFLSTFVMLFWLDRSDHMVIPMYPLFTLGLSLLLVKMYDISLQYFGRFKQVNAALVSLILVFYPLAVTVYYNVDSFITGGVLSVENVKARVKVAGFVNERVARDDVVLCDSHLARMINCKTSVLIQSAAFEGKSIAYMRGDYGRDRFLFNCSYVDSKFIVLMNGTMEWARNQSALIDTANDIQNWPYDEVEGYLIYRNPNL